MIAALAAPVIHSAAYCSWPYAAAVGLICGGIHWGMSRLSAEWYETGIIRIAGWIWGALVLGRCMEWTRLYWGNEWMHCLIPIVILILAGYCVRKGEVAAENVVQILRWFLLFLLGSVFLSSIKEIQAGNLKAEWVPGSGELIAVLLLPAIGRQRGKDRIWRLPLLSAAAAFTVSGVMSAVYASGTGNPFYELSRTATILGQAKRFESLVASGITLGFFGTAVYILCSANPSGTQSGKWHWLMVMIAVVLTLLPWKLDGRYLAIGAVVVWVLLPAFETIKNNYKKCQKTIDK